MVERVDGRVYVTEETTLASLAASCRTREELPGLDRVPFVLVGRPSIRAWWFDDVENIQAQSLNLASSHNETLTDSVYPQIVLPLSLLSSLESQLREEGVNGERVVALVRELTIGRRTPIIESGEDKGVSRYIAPGGDPHCVCHAWEGMVLSLTGKTKGLPTYEQAREAGCFHPNCVHTLEYVDEAADAEEVERAKAHPFDEGTDAGRRRREIEIARIREEDGLGEEEAKTRLDRADLAGAIRAGLVRADAEAVVAKMTDAQVRALSKGGTPPEFVPVKKVRGGTRSEPKYEPEAWNRGANGGVVHVRRDATAEDMSRIVVEKTTEDLMKALGHRRTDKPLGIDGVNPRFGEDRRYQTNCQRCVVVNEARERGYDVSALPDDGNWDGVRFWEDFYDPRNSVRVCANGRMFRRDLERKAAKDPDGSRYVVRIRLKSTGGGHFFSAYKTKNGIVYKDPQDTRRNAADHFLDAGGRPGDSWFMRVDNRMFAQDAKDAIS